MLHLTESFVGIVIQHCNLYPAKKLSSPATLLETSDPNLKLLYL